MRAAVRTRIAERRVIPLSAQSFLQRQQQRRRESEAGTFGAHGLGYVQITGTGRVSLGTSEAKTNATPANEPIAFPLTPTPSRRGQIHRTAHKLLMQSRARERRANSPRQSSLGCRSHPVLVSRCTPQTHWAPSSCVATRSRSHGTPQGTRPRSPADSSGSPDARSWRRTRRSPAPRLDLPGSLPRLHSPEFHCRSARPRAFAPVMRASVARTPSKRRMNSSLRWDREVGGSILDLVVYLHAVLA